MICPYCLQIIGKLVEKPQRDKSISYVCDHCSEAVPLRYVQDYSHYPPVVLSLVGFSGHGKTVYVSSLLHEIERLVERYPGFSYTCLEEDSLDIIRERQRTLFEGRLPRLTPKVFPKPVILRLEGMPGFKPFHLLIYDQSGEAFNKVIDLKQYAGYINRSPAITWLLSLKAEDFQGAADDFLTRYLQGLTELRGDPRKQMTLINLTKGDLLLSQSDLPERVRQFLNGNDGSGFPYNEAALERLSTELETWLGEQPRFRNFVRRARAEFWKVRYCVVSALGSDPQGETLLVSVAPRGVLAPLQWLLSLEREHEKLAASLVELEAHINQQESFLTEHQTKVSVLRLRDGLQRVRESMQANSWVHAQEQLQAVEGEFQQRLEQAQEKKKKRLVGVMIVVGLIVAFLAVVSWQWWAQQRKNQSWYKREHIAEILIEGGTIELPPGEYRLPKTLTLRKPLSLKSSGEGMAHITAAEGDAVLIFAGDGTFEATSISFEYTGNQPANVVVIQSGQTRLQKCWFTGAIRDKNQRDKGDGLQLRGEVKGTVSGCQFQNNEQNGISIRDKAQPELEGNSSLKNKGSGIAFSGAATGSARNNTLSENQSYGIEISGRSQPIIETNTCRENNKSGIGYLDEASGIARKNRCESNRLNGLSLDGKASPQIEGNSCTGNREGSGIAYFGTTAGTASNNTCTNNELGGIAITKQAQPTLGNNTCSDNKRFGLIYVENGAGTANGNQCERNGISGISVEGLSRPDLEGNVCKNNRGSGIRFTGKSKGTAQKNDCSGNQYYGILIKDQAQPSVGGNTCKDNEKSGIAYFDMAAGSAQDNQCTDNKEHGILVSGQAQPVLGENRLTGNLVTDLRDWRTPEVEDPEK